MVALNAVPVGQPFRVEKICGPESFVERMYELGLVPGTVATVLRHSLLGGTVQLRTGTTTFAIRLPAAAAIMVTPLREQPIPHSCQKSGEMTASSSS
ncbi:MAG: FeoA family protein [Bacteroidota bacterium]|nr:ferrous iron transport protein A [Candidatus Kapabacteria bacterium]MCX7936351.1 ferrous iron transport protein A [Chlorobiota bacterium]MDW8074368.1 FeoA family protein [Bacteroidota bacterium]MDW8271156.1 FeoA family protein [Bacteroidota bacterium]